MTITCGDNCFWVGGIIGAGFYNEEVAQAMSAPFDKPIAYTVADCAAGNVAVNDKAVEYYKSMRLFLTCEGQAYGFSID